MGEKSIKVVKALIKKSGTYLFLQRAPTSKFFPGLWDFPGGKVKQHEDINEALVREVQEETSLHIEPENKVADILLTEEGNKIHFLVFSTKPYKGKVMLSADHTDSQWLSRKDIAKYRLAPVVKHFFEL